VPEVVQTVTDDAGERSVVRTEADLGPGGTCDRPSILSGCVPGSRVGVIDSEDGARFYLSCRVSAFDTPAGRYDDLALIGRADDGATCLWGVPFDRQRRDGADLPTPGADDDDTWASPAELAPIGCRRCHDGNAIVVTPFVAANLPPHPADGPFVTPFARELAAVEPSWAGTAAWAHPDAAPCRACHDLSAGSVCLLGPLATGRTADPLANPALARWPTDRWMDDLDPAALVARHGDEAGWESAFGAASDRLTACCSGDDDGCWEPPEPSEDPW
jgi:hypothetical protein